MTYFVILSSYLHYRQHLEKFPLQLTVGVIPTSCHLWPLLHIGLIMLKVHLSRMGHATLSIFGLSLLLSIVYPAGIQVNIWQQFL